MFFFLHDTATTEISTLSLHDALPIFAALTKLDLMDNKITVLPDAFGQLTALTRLNLNSNKLEDPPMVLARLPNLTALHLVKNPFLEKPGWWQGQDNIGFVNLAREREKTDPARCLAAFATSPDGQPRAFTHDACAEAWARDGWRAPLFAALLAMLDGWAFKPPIEHEPKWRYLEEHVFPLAADVWGDAGRFRQLQDLAKRRKGELEAQCRVIVAAVANDTEGDGGWICSELDDIAGDVVKGAARKVGEGEGGGGGGGGEEIGRAHV